MITALIAGFSRYRMVLEFLAVLALLALACEWWHHHDMQEQAIGYQQAVAEYQRQLIEAKAAADKQHAEDQKRVQEAENHANERDQQLQTLLTAGAASSDSLRRTLDAIGRSVPTASVTALRQNTLALTAVLSDCQQRYRNMAAKADGHANDVKTLMDGWPQPQQ